MELKSTYTSSIKHIYKNKENFKERWKEEQRLETGINFSESFLDDIFEKSFKQAVVSYKNSVKGTTEKIPAMQFVYDTFDEDRIIVENGVMFQNQRKVFAPTVESEVHLFYERKRIKKLGNYYLTTGNDPVLGAIYDNMQGNTKILMNTYYGVLTNPYSRFFNRDLGDSVTTRGRSSISVSALAIEGAFSKRIPKRADAILAYFRRCTEQYVSPHILEEMVSKKYGVQDILNEFNLNNHYAKSAIIRRLCLYNEEELAKIIFKNNFKLMTTLDIFQKAIFSLFEMCMVNDIPFLDPNELPQKKINDKTVELKEAGDIIEFLKQITREVLCGMYWYGGDYIQDKKMIVNNPQETILGIDRHTIPVIDTDSNFLSYETEYLYMYDIIKKRNKGTFVLQDKDEDNTFYTISNICAIIMCEVIDYALDRYKHHINVMPEKFGCLKLKNEFLFTKVLITSRKKSYITVVALKEGKPYPERKVDTKGLVYIKSSINSNIGDNTKKIVDYIMTDDNMNIKTVLNKIRTSSDHIIGQHKTQSLLDYCVVLKMKTSLENSDPSDYRYKAISLWNSLVTSEADLILPPASFYSVPIKITEEFKTKNKEIYLKISNWVDRRNKFMIRKQVEEIISENKKGNEFMKLLKETTNLENINNVKDWEEARAKVMSIKKKDKLDITTANVNYITVDDIDRIAFPLTLEFVPDWVTDLVNTNNSLILMNNLIAPVVQELHLLSPRNSEDKRIVTNILDVY